MPIVPESSKTLVPRAGADQVATHTDSWMVAADPDNITITTETFTQVLDKGDPAVGISPMIQVTIKTTVQPK